MGAMIIKPKVRGFVCVTAHPEGCARHVGEQIAFVKAQGALPQKPRNVLVIGSSTGYGLASRIAAAFGASARTFGVFFERPSSKGKPASAGWYNMAAFARAAEAEGLYAGSANGDAFSDEMKAEVIGRIEKEMGPLDLVIYSLAAPRRTDPVDGVTYRSCLKPIGEPYTAQTLDTDRKEVVPVTLEPASEEEIHATVKVMGGEDWQRWIDQLDRAGLLAEGFRTVAYDYVGPEVTWPVYHHGTIGRAKAHLRETARRIDEQLQEKSGKALISVNKAVVTQASSAIPVVPLYISILFRVMKEEGLHEDCIHQIDRLFREQLYAPGGPQIDSEGCIRMDDREMLPEIQARVKELWPQVTTGSVEELTDYAGYQQGFLQLFGFGLEGVDYEAETEPDVGIPGLRNPG
mgnify:FL=1